MEGMGDMGGVAGSTTPPLTSSMSEAEEFVLVHIPSEVPKDAQFVNATDQGSHIDITDNNGKVYKVEMGENTVEMVGTALHVRDSDGTVIGKGIQSEGRMAPSVQE